MACWYLQLDISCKSRSYGNTGHVHNHNYVNTQSPSHADSGFVTGAADVNAVWMSRVAGPGILKQIGLNFQLPFAIDLKPTDEVECNFYIGAMLLISSAMEWSAPCQPMP